MGRSRALRALRILFAVEALAFVAVRLWSAVSSGAWLQDNAFPAAPAEWVPVYLLGVLAWALRRREPHVYWALLGTQLFLVLLSVQAAVLLMQGEGAPADVVLAAAVGPLHLAILAAALPLRFRMRFLVGLDPDLARIHAGGRVAFDELRAFRALGDGEGSATFARLHAAGGFLGAIDHESRQALSASALATERGIRCPGCAAVMTVGTDRCGSCDRSLLVGDSRNALGAPVAVRIAVLVTALVAFHHVAGALLRIAVLCSINDDTLAAAAEREGPTVFAASRANLALPVAALVAGLVLFIVAGGLGFRRRWAHRAFLALCGISILIDSTRIGAFYYADLGNFDFHPPVEVRMAALAVELSWLAVKIAGLVLLLRPYARVYLRRSLAGWARGELDRHGEITIEALSSHLRLPPHRAAAVALDLAAAEVDEAVLDLRRGALVELDRLSEDDEERHCTECGAPVAHLAVGRACGWCGAGELSVHATYRS